PYKNVELLLDSMKDLPEYTLHLLSKILPERRKELKQLIPQGAKVKFWNSISEKDYYKLLANSSLLVSASRSEGFGLPVIEAMGLGVPVACSDIEIFHEVGGEAALYFSPDSPQEFVQSVRQLEDTKVRNQLIEKGRKQS